MASNRHLGRIVALQTLYEYDFRVESEDKKVDSKEILERNILRYSETIEDKDFIRNLTDMVITKQTALDDVIIPVAPEWPIKQIARIDRNILRMAIAELKHSPDVPPKVVINEAVELAKAFGSENSSKFVNGVLGTIYRELESESKKSKPKATKKTKQKKPAAKKTTKTATKSSKTTAKPKKATKSKNSSAKKQ